MTEQKKFPLWSFEKLAAMSAGHFFATELGRHGFSLSLNRTVMAYRVNLRHSFVFASRMLQRTIRGE